MQLIQRVELCVGKDNVVGWGQGFSVTPEVAS